ncbi:MAG: hypothetical protein HY064_11890 [Bacteroidetes bacterium]|nr:hypothetical protein [Bacteroidota bacterium]
MDTSSTEHYDYAEEKIGKKQKSTGKKALIFFSSGASIIYFAALYYCYSTGHIMETYVVGGAMLVVGAFLIRAYRAL